MCGLAGEVRFDAAPDVEGVRRATRSLAHRGPDDEGFFLEGPAALGHRRLSILDLEGGVQPMVQDGIALVFNGQIYRHDALRAELRTHGHPFRTRSDTEVVLRAYLEWGERFVERLDGMFAIALWDARHRRLVLARDRMGKKPLHYALADGERFLEGEPVEEGTPVRATRLVFGSELKSLFAHGGVPRTLDTTSLVQYLGVESVPAPRSLIAAVKKLPAAHVAVLEGDTFRVQRYWELPAPRQGPAPGSAAAFSLGPGDPLLPGSALHEASRELLRLLDGAVARRLVADVPVGVFLSGGIDSSAISALAARHKSPLDTFSIGFSEASFDETPYARAIAEHLGSRHQTQVLTGQDCLDLVPTAVESLCEPLADPSFLPTLLLSRFTRQHVTVALAGDGGDELFAGYDPFLAHAPARLLSLLPHAALELVAQAASLLPSSSKNMSFDFRLKQFLRGVEAHPTLRHQSWLAAFLPSELRGLLVPELQGLCTDDTVFREVLRDADRARALGVVKGSLDEALRFYQQRYLADDILVKADRASMAASLELRAPFLDVELVEWAARLPASMKLSFGTTKAILKRALVGVLPQAILDRPKKGFGIPVAAWIRGPMKGLFTELFSAAELAKSGVFQPAAAQALLARHLSGQADLRKPLWTLAMFLLWQRRQGAQTAPQAGPGA